MKRKNIRIIALGSILLLAVAITAQGGNRFGPQGLKGLSKADQARLAKGEIIFSTETKNDESKEGNALVEATVVFDATPQEVWKLLYRTETQIRYLEEIEEVKLLKKEATEDLVQFKVGVAWIDVEYRVIHHFKPKDLSYRWELDKSYKSDLVALQGYWHFYPYGNGKTLGRYGSNVSVKNVPSFIEAMFKKNGVKKALRAVRRYINSKGTWRCSR